MSLNSDAQVETVRIALSEVMSDFDVHTHEDGLIAVTIHHLSSEAEWAYIWRALRMAQPEETICFACFMNGGMYSDEKQAMLDRHADCDYSYLCAAPDA